MGEADVGIHVSTRRFCCCLVFYFWRTEDVFTYWQRRPAKLVSEWRAFLIGNSQCQGPEAELCLACWKNSHYPMWYVVGSERARETLEIHTITSFSTSSFSSLSSLLPHPLIFLSFLLPISSFSSSHLLFLLILYSFFPPLSLLPLFHLLLFFFLLLSVSSSSPSSFSSFSSSFQSLLPPPQ